MEILMGFAEIRNVYNLQSNIAKSFVETHPSFMGCAIIQLWMNIIDLTLLGKIFKMCSIQITK